jgi:NitT/TauT family transport system permease protein
MVVNKSIIIPSPEETVVSLFEIITAQGFLVIILNTLRRVLLGFLLSFFAGLFLGVLAGFINPIYFLLKPYILIQKSIPTMAIILIAIIWLSSDITPILVGFLVIFPIIYGSVVTGIKSIDSKLLEMAHIYQLSLKLRITKLYIPSIRDSLITTVSTTLSLNLKIIIAAEVLSQPNKSIGTSFQIEKAMLNTSGVFAWAIITILIATLFDVIIRLVKNRYVHS